MSMEEFVLFILETCGSFDIWTGRIGRFSEPTISFLELIWQHARQLNGRNRRIFQTYFVLLE